jgi:hypothetical protein
MRWHVRTRSARHRSLTNWTLPTKELIQVKEPEEPGQGQNGNQTYLPALPSLSWELMFMAPLGIVSSFRKKQKPNGIQANLLRSLFVTIIQ